MGAWTSSSEHLEGKGDEALFGPKSSFWLSDAHRRMDAVRAMQRLSIGRVLRGAAPDQLLF